MKRLMLLVIGLVLLAGMVSIAQAATTQDISVKVTVTAELAVIVDRSEYNFGTHSVGVTTISTQAITVTNSSTETAESYKLNGSNTTPDSWTLSGAPGENIFELRAMFYGASDTDSPVEVDFHDSNDDLTDTAQYCTANQFAEDAGPAGENGINVATTAPRYLWFLLKTPTTLTMGGGDEQTSTVTVTAAYPE